jgi:hypothetical protein
MTAHGDDVFMTRVIFRDALTQAAHQGVKGLLAGDVICASPDVTSNLFSGDHSSLRLHQHFQQAILLKRERRNDLLASHEDAPALLVYVNATRLKPASPG